MFHLPDIPNVGYATSREREGTDAIMLFMREVERDRVRLLSIVVDGPDKWRQVASQVFGTGLGIGTEAINEIYWYFVLQSARPLAQRALIQARKRPDITQRIIATIMPHIERELVKLRLQRKWQP